MNNNKTILIYAHNTMGDPITNLKDYLQLHLQTLLGEEMVILSCNEERSNGIYAFHIEDSQCLFARVFVRLSQDVTQGNITYYKIPYSLHPTCHQINILACMLDNTKAISYTFDSYPQTFIGIIKAYKKDKQQDNDNAFSNPHNEIYTLDTEQEIQLKAFIYEAQKTYMPLGEIKDKKTQIERNYKEEQGNITKNIISPPPMVSLNIRWAFKIVSDSYHGENATTGRLKQGTTSKGEPFPPLKKEQDFIILEDTNTCICASDSKEASQGTPKLTSIPQGYVEIKNKRGDTLDFKLSDIFSKELLKDNTDKTKTLIDKNIIFFAYDENVGINTDTDTNAYRVYQEYDKNINNRIISQDRVTSIELKILKTRLSLEFDGEYLRLYENQREIEKWEAKKGNNTDKPIKEGEYSIFVPTNCNPQNLDLKGIECNKEDICKVFKTYRIENLSIPLKVQYQKRVVITIERFKQTSEATMGKVYICLDGKVVNVESESVCKKVKNSKTNKDECERTDDRELIGITQTQIKSMFAHTSEPFAYILERPGPDCIAGEVKLRIPEGRYEVEWQNGGGLRRQEVLKLYNNFVHQNRAILIHEGYTKSNTGIQAQEGTSPRNTFGCLVIAKERVKDKNNPKEFADNILGADSSKKKDLANIIKEVNGLSQYLFDEDTRIKLKSDNARAKAVVKHIEIRIKNNFKEGIQEKIPQSPLSLEFNGKTLTIIINENNSIQKIPFQAVSGKAKEDNGKHYFTYEKERQMLKSEGPIPEGEYYIDTKKITEAAFYRNISWGGKNVPIELNDQETYGRYGFYIHGGWSAGSAGCIDLWDSNELFFEKLIEYSKRLNISKILLSVKYNDTIMECSNNLLNMIKQCEAKL